jgi:hypothetical protein
LQGSLGMGKTDGIGTPAGEGPLSASSSTTVVATAGPTGSTPKGGANDVFFNNDSGRCWTYRQHPRGPAINVLLQVVIIVSIF